MAPHLKNMFAHEIISLAVDMDLFRMTQRKLNVSARQIGHRVIFVMTMDAVVVGSLDSLLDRADDFIIWKDVLATGQPARFKYNTSLILMNAGARSKVWETFNQKESLRTIAAEHRCGSDQAWVSHCLNNEKTWDDSSGVLSWRFNVKGKQVSDNAKIVFFHGREKPWDIPNVPLVRQYWN